jgi:hypothetical protein
MLKLLIAAYSALVNHILQRASILCSTGYHGISTKVWTVGVHFPAGLWVGGNIKCVPVSPYNFIFNSFPVVTPSLRVAASFVLQHNIVISTRFKSGFVRKMAALADDKI